MQSQGSPVSRKSQSTKEAGRLDSLVRHVVNSDDTPGVIVNTMPPVLGSQERWDQSCMPIIGYEETLLTIRHPWRLTRPAHIFSFLWPAHLGNC